MGALPKNKITRVEQGKRRRGNMPKLKKDLNSATPMHKQGFVAELLRFVGLSNQPAVKVASKTEKAAESSKKVTTTAQIGQTAKAAPAKARPAKGSAGSKVTRKTQHKG